MKLFWAIILSMPLTFGHLAHAEEAAAAPKLTPHQMRDDTLDSLFAKLQQASNDVDAKVIEQKIWAAWVQSDSVTADVLLKQAEAAMGVGDNRASLTILNQIIATYPTYAEAWNKRATLKFMIGRYDESLADIEKVLDLEPRHFGALSGRGMIFASQKKWSDALMAYKSALAVNPHMESVKNAIQLIEKTQPEL
jgi:tetratricopeptide (TPR) repeat protein